MLATVDRACALQQCEDDREANEWGQGSINPLYLRSRIRLMHIYHCISPCTDALARRRSRRRQSYDFICHLRECAAGHVARRLDTPRGVDTTASAQKDDIGQVPRMHVQGSSRSFLVIAGSESRRARTGRRAALSAVVRIARHAAASPQTGRASAPRSCCCCSL